ncbi:hypothetical protein HPB47_018094, partial [Ixodes persulcatus]
MRPEVAAASAPLEKTNATLKRQVRQAGGPERQAPMLCADANASKTEEERVDGNRRAGRGAQSVIALEYTGSFYEGLRIKKADEFDINLVLNLPFEKDEFTVSDGCPGHVGYEVGEAAVDRLHREGDAKWVSLLEKLMDGGRLVPDRIRLRQHGPAVTLYIKLKDGNQIDVDLVPAIEFHHPSWPTGVQKKGWMANMLPE